MLLFLVPIGAVALVVAELLRRRVRNYRAALGYSPRYNQRFTCDGSNTFVTPLVAVDDGYEWSVPQGSWDSVFVEILVEAGSLGSLLDPYVEVTLGHRTIRQYFERGASGLRIVNLTDFLTVEVVAGGRHVLRIRGKRLRCGTSGSRLHFLGAARPAPGPVLIFAPHPDDAEIAAFGLISKSDAWVVTVTMGDGGPSLYADFFDSTADAFAEKANIRVWDSLVTPLLAGVAPERIVNLGYFDGTLAAMFRDPEWLATGLHSGTQDISLLRRNSLDETSGPRSATWRGLVADVEVLLNRIKPTAIVLPHPAIDPHPDHQYTTIAILEAIVSCGLSHGRLLFYANHLNSTELFPFGDNDGVVSIPPFVESASFESILSLSLDRKTRLRKRLALSAQHDLQPPVDTHSPSLAKIIRNSIREPYIHIVGADMHYNRRAVRPNELFFVTGFEKADEIRSAFILSNNSKQHAEPAKS